MDGLCIARPTSSPDEFALIDRTTPTLRFIWNTGNLVLGLMPKQLIFVTLVVVFTASCSQDFLWQGGPGSELHAYRASFTASAGRELVAQVPRAQLLRDLKSAQILWLGDHHRHSRLHALQMELLQQLQQQGRAMCLGLEAIGVQDQPLVDDFLAGGATADADADPLTALALERARAASFCEVAAAGWLLCNSWLLWCVSSWLASVQWLARNSWLP